MAQVGNMLGQRLSRSIGERNREEVRSARDEIPTVSDHAGILTRISLRSIRATPRRCSPDGAKRHLGPAVPHFAALNAGYDLRIVCSPPSRPTSALAPMARTNSTISMAYMRGMSNRL